MTLSRFRSPPRQAEVATERSGVPSEGLAVSLLGRAEVRYEGSLVGANVPPKTRALLAFILLNPLRRVEREAAAFSLWPDEPEAKALANLRRYLYRLTRNLLPVVKQPWLTATARFIAWQEDALVAFDVADFETATAPPIDAKRAVDLYRGDLMESFDEPWVEPLRARLRERLTAVGHAALESREELQARSAIALAKRLVAHDPLDEVAVRALLQRRTEIGDRIGALREFDEFRKVAREEFGVEPSAETRALQQHIVADLQTSVAANDRDARLAGVPLIATPLFGREAERTAVGESLAAHPLVALLGIGGIGKTRLAIDVATSMIDLFPGGVAFVDVARAEREERVLPLFADALGVSRLATVDDLETRAIGALNAERRVVIVDNCERHPASVARLLNRIVPLSPGSRFIVTSREQLALDDELVHWVQPLDRSSAAALFVDRACRALSADGTAAALMLERSTVDTIVTWLDGIPLALELAASRAATVGLDDLAARLAQAIGLHPYQRGRPPRGKTMGAVLDWSYDCLDVETARVFRHLSTFAGGWTVQRACAAFAAEDEERVRFALGDLVDAALVVVDRSEATTRYRFLEPIRAYAAARLSQAGEEVAARRRHAEAVLRAAEKFVDAGQSLAMATRVARANAEVDDLRAALQWALVNGNDLELGTRLAASSMYLLFVAPDEGRSYVFEALRAVDQRSSPKTQAKLYQALSRHAKESLRFAEAYAAAKYAIELARKLGDDDLLCAFTLNAIMAAVGTQRLDEAESLATECVAIASARGHLLFERQARGLLPVVVSARRDYDRARSLFLELLANEGSMSSEGLTFQTQAVEYRGNFAENEFLAGRVEEAIRLGTQAAAIAEECGELPGLRAARSNQCVFLCAAGRFSEARALALATIEDARKAGLGALVTFAVGSLAEVAEARGRITESAAIAAYVRRRLEAEGFVRHGAQELHASKFEARLRDRLDETALARAASVAATWDEGAAIDFAFAASADASEPATGTVSRSSRS